MPQPSYPRLESLFHAARDLSADEQSLFLRKECDGDPSLLRELKCLLVGHAQSTGHLLALPERDPSTPQLQLPAIRQGVTLGSKYRIIDKLGEGGMGIIYSAWHAHLDMPVVVKVLRASMSLHQEAVQRFLNEARAAARIRDPGIVRIFDVDRHDSGDLYIVMELLVGETLQDRLRRSQLVPCVQAIRWMRQVARALAMAHAKGIIHRDLKPSNIFLVQDPEVPGGERIKLLDFGIAKLTEKSDALATRAGTTFGTPPYMAPEQFVDAATVNHRADLYSLGIILFETMCGQRPFQASSWAGYEEAHRFAPVPNVSDLVGTAPPALHKLVSWMLAKRPSQRIATAGMVTHELDKIHKQLGHANDSSEATHIADSDRSPLSVLPPPLSGPRRQTATMDTVAASLGALRRSNPEIPISSRVNSVLGSRSEQASQVSDSQLVSSPSEVRSERAAEGSRLVVSQFIAIQNQSDILPRTGPKRLLRAISMVSPAKIQAVRTIRLPGMIIVLVALSALTAFFGGWTSSRNGPPVVFVEPVHDGSEQPESSQQQLGQRALYNQLREWLDTDSTETRLDVVATLSDIASPAAADLLYRALGDQGLQVRLRAAETLARLQWRASVPRLREVYAESVGPLRVQMAACLMVLGDNSAVAELRAAFDRKGALRLLAATALAHGLNDERALRHLRHVVRELPRGSKNWLTAAEALLARRHENTRKQLRDELIRNEPERAVNAAVILSRHGDQTGKQFLRMTLRDPLFERRLDVALALAHLDEQVALAPVRDWLASRDARTRQVAVLIAGRLAAQGGHAYQETITTLLEDDAPLVRMAAHAAVLAFINLPQAQGDSP